MVTALQYVAAALCVLCMLGVATSLGAGSPPLAALPAALAAGDHLNPRCPACVFPVLFWCEMCAQRAGEGLPPLHGHHVETIVQALNGAAGV